MSDDQKQAHDFAISVLNDYLSKNNLTNNLTEISKLTSNDSDSFNIYYFSYYGFLHSLKCCLFYTYPSARDAHESRVAC